MANHHRVMIETGAKRVFASALDWPGWCRSAKTEEDALAALRQYAERYGRVADHAGVPGAAAAADFRVVERLPGTMTTDFGAPDAAAACEREPMTPAECERQIALLRGCWEEFDAIAGRVSEELRKGPRGGGRDREKLKDHTFEAERSYVRNLGVRTPTVGMSTPDGLQQHRDTVCEAIRAINAEGGTARKWPLRYFIRRAAWHVMDHAWEMEDKDLTGQESRLGRVVVE